MLEHLIETGIPIVIEVLELMGTSIIAIGAVSAFYKYIVNLFRKTNYSIKLDLAQALALALEFKLAGEILKTVIVKSFEEMGMLAVIIVLRAVLTFVIHWEIKGEKEH